jgi:hypothetical protein
MPTVKSKMTLFLQFAVLVFLAFLVVPANSIGKSPGVSVGYWVKYGNITATGIKYIGSGFNETEWIKIEVVGVSGTEVTFSMSRTFKNGSIEKGADIISDVDTGWATGGLTWRNHFLIAANLIQNDTFTTIGIDVLISKTENRSYAGMDRTVNIVNYTESEDYYYELFMVYDQISGFLLEMNTSLTSVTLPTGNEELSFVAVELNMKASSQYTLIYIATGIAVAVVAVSAVVLWHKKAGRKKIVKSNKSAVEEKGTNHN